MESIFYMKHTLKVNFFQHTKYIYLKSRSLPLGNMVELKIKRKHQETKDVLQNGNENGWKYKQPFNQ